MHAQKSREPSPASQTVKAKTKVSEQAKDPVLQRQSNSLWHNMATNVAGQQAGSTSIVNSRSAGSRHPPSVQRESDEDNEEVQAENATIQPKLTIGAADDPYEREADDVADRVMRMPADDQQETEQRNADVVQTRPVAGAPVQRSFGDVTDVANVQAKSGWPASETDVPVEVQKAVSSPGSGAPVSDSIRSRVEPVLGADLSSVRVHSTTGAQQASRSIQARAFTHKNNVFLGSGESAGDVGLMAHELTHTVQQGGVSRIRKQEQEEAEETVQASRAPGVQAAWYNFDIPGTNYRFDPSWRGVKYAAGLVRDTAVSGMEKVLELVAEQAQNIPGFSLLTLVIGYNPVTQKDVDRAELLAGMLDSVPFGKKLGEHIKHLGKLAGNVMTWVDEQFTESGLTLSKIKTKFSNTVDSLSWHDFLLPPKAAYKVVKNFVVPVGKSVLDFVFTVAEKLFGKIFEWLLGKIGPHAKTIMGFVSKVSSVFMTIAKDPIDFAKKLGSAIKSGFDLFRENIVKHLKKALAELVFGPLKIDPPKEITFSSVIGLVMQVLGLTYSTGIRPKLTKRLGEKRVAFVENSIAVIQEVKDKGIVVLWEKMKMFLGNLKELVIGKVKEWIITKIVIAGVKWVAGLIVPGGAFIKAIESVYAMFKVFLDRWQQIKDVFNSIFGSISKIVNGETKDAAVFIEKLLGKGLSLLLSFLANLMGLGGIGAKVREIIQSIKERIHAALDRLVGYIINLIGKLFGKAKFAVGKALQWWKRSRSIKGANKKSVTLSISGGATDPQVMIKASPKRRYSAYLEARKPDMTTKEQKQAMKEAEKQADIIENRRKKPSETDEQIAGIKLNAFNSLAEQLQIISGGTPTPISQVTFGSPNEDQGGTEMTASILSNDHAKGSHVSDSPPIYTNLYHLRKGKGPPYYIQGHLLNNNLGGPGKRYNLSPITTGANGKHLHNVEKPIKKWVHSRSSPIVMYYHVKVDYPAISDTKRFKELNEKAADTRSDAENRELALLQQKRLANSFICNAHKLKYDNGSWTKDSEDSEHTISYTVVNK